MTDYKQLCAELLAALESWSPNGGAPLEEGAEAIAEARLIERARAALSQPEPAGLSDEELLKALKLAINSFPPAHPDAEGMSGAQYEVTLELRKARAVEAATLARAQHQPVPPEPEGPTHRITPDDFRRWWRETGSASPAPSPEMLLTANAWAQYCLSRWGRQVPMESKFNIKWALDALERLRDASMRYRLGVFSREELQLYEDRAQKVIEAWSRGDEHEMSGSDATPQPVPPQPVPVSERLPGPEDCIPHPRTKLGNCCWGFGRLSTPPAGLPAAPLVGPRQWTLMYVETIELECSHWLPAHALPLPGEVKG